VKSYNPRSFFLAYERAAGEEAVVLEGTARGGHAGAESTSPNVDATHSTAPLVHPKPACTVYSPPVPDASTSNMLNFSYICPVELGSECVRFNSSGESCVSIPGIDPPVAYQLQNTLAMYLFANSVASAVDHGALALTGPPLMIPPVLMVLMSVVALPPDSSGCGGRSELARPSWFAGMRSNESVLEPMKDDSGRVVIWDGSRRSASIAIY